MINEQALKDKIKKIALEREITFNACWKQLLLERFLARLAASPHSDKFIFKGGFLLAYLLKIGRETLDLDFLVTRMKVAPKELQEIIHQVISVHSLDGFIFMFDSIQALPQPHMEYRGFRISINTLLGKMKDQIQVDIGVGDVVEEIKREIPLIQYPGQQLFEASISLLVYPVETIFSEKLETIFSRGSANSRMKDFHDVILIIREGMLDSEKLKQTLENTFSHRGTSIKRIKFDEPAVTVMQKLWTNHLNGLGDIAHSLDLPVDFLAVIDEINNFLIDQGIVKIESATVTS